MAALLVSIIWFIFHYIIIPQGSFQYIDTGGISFGTCESAGTLLLSHMLCTYILFLLLHMTVVSDRNQLKDISVENATYVVGENRSRYEVLSLYPEKIRYTLRE